MRIFNLVHILLTATLCICSNQSEMIKLNPDTRSCKSNLEEIINIDSDGILYDDILRKSSLKFKNKEKNTIGFYIWRIMHYTFE